MRARSRIFHLKNSVFLSLVIHSLLFIVAAAVLKHSRRALLGPKTTWIQLAPPLHTPQAKKEPKEKESKDDPRGHRVVQTEKGEMVKKPLPQAFLGEKNQIVDRETVSKDHRIAMSHDAESVKPSDSNASQLPKQSARRAQSGSKIKDLGKLGLALLPTAKEMDQIILKKQAEGDRPNWAQADSTRSLAHDYIQGLKEGEQTALNTREFVFYGYYQRIRERLDRAWVPVLRQKLQAHFLSGRRIGSETEHTTRVLVILNSAGEVVHVKVTSESGTPVIDDAAVSAFNLAGPFPNPPRGLVDPDGEIKIPWEFILKS